MGRRRRDRGVPQGFPSVTRAAHFLCVSTHRRARWRITVCIALHATLFCASVGAAQSVVLVRPDAQDSELLDVYHRLQGELSIHHFEAVEVDAAALPTDAL